MSRPLPLATVLALLCATAAGAEPPSWSARCLERDLGSTVSPTPVAAQTGSSGARVAAGPLALTHLKRLGVFADRMVFRVESDGNGVDLRGGAYLRLRRNLTLRGSYRIFDYDRLEGHPSLETDHHGPHIGLNFRF